MNRRSPGHTGIDPLRAAKVAVKYFQGLTRQDISLEDRDHIIDIMRAYIKESITAFSVWRELVKLENKNISLDVRREVENLKSVFRGVL